MLSVLIDIFAAPANAFRTLQTRAHWLLPLALIVGGVALTNFYYFSVVDPEFMLQEMMSQAGDDMSDAERAEAREAFESMGPGTMKWVSVGSGAIAVAVILALHALYYLLVSMFLGHGIAYKHWFCLVCWSTVPIILTFIAGFVTLLLADGQDVRLSKLNPLTFTNLLDLNVERGSLRNMLDTLDITRIWSLALLVLGYRLWTESSWLKSIAVALLPMLVIYGIWLYAAL